MHVALTGNSFWSSVNVLACKCPAQLPAEKDGAMGKSGALCAVRGVQEAAHLKLQRHGRVQRQYEEIRARAFWHSRYLLCQLLHSLHIM